MAYYKKEWKQHRESTSYRAWFGYIIHVAKTTEGRCRTVSMPCKHTWLLPLIQRDLFNIKISWEKPATGDVYTEVRIEW